MQEGKRGADFCTALERFAPSGKVRGKRHFFQDPLDLFFGKEYTVSIPRGGIGGPMEKHEHTHAVLRRLARASGHLDAVRRMIEEGRDCSEVLIQLSAVRAELANAGKVILKDHIDHCVVRAVRENDEESIRLLKGAIDSLL